MRDEFPELTWEEAVQSLRCDPASGELVRACYYDDPLLEAANRYWRSAEWATIRGLLPKPPGTALDVGAGRGIATYALARDGWNTTALEPDPSAIVGGRAIRMLAAESRLDLTVVETWGEQLPFDQACFNVVHCRAVLHHARDLRQLCREIARVLKPGGTFIATREHVVSHHADIAAFQRSHALHHLYGGEYAYLLNEYQDAIRSAGLDLRRTLNPMESDINLFPNSREDVKRNWAKRIGLPIAWLIPDALLTFRGRILSTPGRIYSFVSTKPDEA